MIDMTEIMIDIILPLGVLVACIIFVWCTTHIKRHRRTHSDHCLCDKCKEAFTRKVHQFFEQKYAAEIRREFEKTVTEMEEREYREKYGPLATRTERELMQQRHFVQMQSSIYYNIPRSLAHTGNPKGSIYGQCGECGITHASVHETCNDARKRYAVCRLMGQKILAGVS